MTIIIIYWLGDAKLFWSVTINTEPLHKTTGDSEGCAVMILLLSVIDFTLHIILLCVDVVGARRMSSDAASVIIYGFAAIVQ